MIPAVAKLGRKNRAYRGLNALESGLRRVCDDVRTISPKDPVPDECDFLVMWSDKPRPARLDANRKKLPTLVMDRGYFYRHETVSLGWNGLNGSALRPDPRTPGELPYVLPELRPWKQTPDEGILICGQVPGDAALEGVNIDDWVRQARETMRTRYPRYRITYRPHPKTLPPGHSQPPLAEIIRDYGLVVTYSSNAGVDAAINGVPVIACSSMSMAYDVSSIDLRAPLVRRERDEWLNTVAWSQFVPEQLVEGTAAEYMMEAYDAACRQIRG